MNSREARKDARSDEDDEDDEDEGLEFEEVLEEPDQPSTSARAGDGIEVTLKPGSSAAFATTVSVGGKNKGRGKGRPNGFSAQAAAERQLRQDIHKLHTACLLLAGHVRNGWLNDRALKARLMSKVPLDVQNRFHDYSKATHPKATDRSRLFEGAIKGLTSWWSNRFRIEDSDDPAFASNTDGLFGLLAMPHAIETFDFQDMLALLADLSESDRVRIMMPFAEDADLQALAEAFPSQGKASTSSPERSKKKKKLPGPVSAELGELIRNSQSLAKRAVKMAGSRDMSAQLFTSLCRALDIPARLVCNLPSIDYRSAAKAQRDDKIGDIRSGGTGTKKRKRAGAGTSSVTENDDEPANSDDDADFEEVSLPTSLPSRALKKTTRSAGNTSESDVARRRPARKAADKENNVVKRLMAARRSRSRAMSHDTEDAGSSSPTFWTEVYNRANQEWITIDPVQNKVRIKKGEYDNGKMFYVVAYEVDQYIKDVTPRYARSFAGRVLKMRISSRRKDEPDWYEELLRPYSRPFVLGREAKEDEELLKQQYTEPMPTVLEGFKNHPRYALERHLKREEVIQPQAKQLGLFRGEPVFPRSSVIAVKSSENWMREGRKIKEGEQPLKMVKQRAVTINRRRAQEQAEQDGMEPLMQGLYSASQTELVIPPPIVDGKIPKNSYGNLDLFAPHMLPAGAVHLPFKTIRKVAKDLGIEYAEAVTGFEFHKRRAVPTVEGIVIAAENEAMVLEAYWEAETAAAEKEAIKRKERCLKRWKKLIIGLRVRSRIQGEYKKDKAKAAKQQQASSTAKDNGEGTSQFKALKEDEERSQFAAVVDMPPDEASPPGGFIHSNELHPDVPGGAAFAPPPPLPEVDLSELHLPPMPAPVSQSNDMQIDGEQKSGAPTLFDQYIGQNGIGQFDLEPPESILADSGVPVDNDEPMDGGFIREDEAGATLSKKRRPKSTDFAYKRNVPSPESDSDTDGVDMEEVEPARTVPTNEQQEQEENEEDEDDVDEEASYRGDSPSPPPKRTRASRSTKSRATKTQSATRSSRRARTSPSPSGSDSVPTTRSSRRKAPAAEPVAKRPTRAAAQRSRQGVAANLRQQQEEPEELEDSNQHRLL